MNSTDCETAQKAADGARETAESLKSAVTKLAGKVKSGTLSESDRKELNELTKINKALGSAAGLTKLANGLNKIVRQIGERGQGVTLKPGNDRPDKNGKEVAAYVTTLPPVWASNSINLNAGFFDSRRTDSWREAIILHEGGHTARFFGDHYGIQATSTLPRKRLGETQIHTLALPIRTNVNEVRMKLIFIIAALWMLSTHAHSDAQQFLLFLNYNGEHKHKIDVKYQNLSDVPQCLRSDDFKFKAIGDFLMIKDENDRSLKFIGDQDDLKNLMWPDSFIIVLPGEERRSAFYVSDSYKIKGKKISAQYALPVIPCSVVLNKHVRLPPVSRLKGQDYEASSFKEAYPDWTADGFLAISNTVIMAK